MSSIKEKEKLATALFKIFNYGTTHCLFDEHLEAIRIERHPIVTLLKHTPLSAW